MLPVDRSFVSAAASLVTHCLLNETLSGSGPVLVPAANVQTVRALSMLTAEVIRSYAHLVEMDPADVLTEVGLLAAEFGTVRTRAAWSLVTAASDPDLLNLLAEQVDEPVLPDLAALAAAFLENIEEVDFSEPAVVLERCAAAI